MTPVLLFLILLGVSWLLAGGRPSPAECLDRRVLSAPGTVIDEGIPGAGTAKSGAVDEGALLLELAGVLLEAGLSVERCLDVLSGCAVPVISTQLRRVVAALTLGAGWDEAWRGGAEPGPERRGRPQQDEAYPGGLWTRIRHGETAAAGIHPALRAVKHYLGFAALSGAPSAGTLQAGAAAERRRTFREAERRAAALGVRLVLPLGLCSLPSFVCLGIIPVVLALLPGVA